jgi:transcriptional regulator with XRE-family HTH domain
MTERALTQEEFARRVNVSTQFISRVINRLVRPGPERARAWAKITGLPLEAFLFPDDFTSHVARRRPASTDKSYVGT